MDIIRPAAARSSSHKFSARKPTTFAATLKIHEMIESNISGRAAAAFFAGHLKPYFKLSRTPLGSTFEPGSGLGPLDCDI